MAEGGVEVEVNVPLIGKRHREGHCLSRGQMKYIHEFFCNFFYAGLVNFPGFGIVLVRWSSRSNAMMWLILHRVACAVHPVDPSRIKSPIGIWGLARIRKAAVAGDWWPEVGSGTLRAVSYDSVVLI
jgi:hypothetical protein